MQRRQLIRAAAAGGALAALGGCATRGGVPASAKVVVVGGGYGGATAAKYVRLLSEPALDVVLIEPNRSFVSCPMSNLVVGGMRQLADITTPYDGLARKHGVQRRAATGRVDRRARRRPSRSPAARSSATTSWCCRPAST